MNNMQTTQEKLQHIIEDMKQRVPRIMEYREGTRLWNKQWGYETNSTDVITNPGYINLQHHFDVIPMPKLTDVMEWLNSLGHSATMTSCGSLFTTKFEEDSAKWNYNKAYLQDQSGSVINFLYMHLQNS